MGPLQGMPNIGARVREATQQWLSSTRSVLNINHDVFTCYAPVGTRRA